MAHRWYQHDERGSPLALRLILWIALHMGRSAARLLLYPIALYFLLTATNQRRASVRFLKRIAADPPSWKNVVCHIHCFASTILDRVYFLTDRFGLFDIRIHNPRVLLDYADAGQGCILLGAHVGSFEVLRALAVDRNLPLKVLMYPEHNRAITRILTDLNPAIRDTVIPLGDLFSLVEVNEHLSNGGMIGMLGDRAAENDKVVSCPFLGSEALFPAGPAVLAATTGVPVILFSGLYRGGNRYDIHFEQLSPGVLLARENREDQIKEWTKRFAERLEHYVRRAPYNWFNFYDFWDEM